MNNSEDIFSRRNLKTDIKKAQEEQRKAEEEEAKKDEQDEAPGDPNVKDKKELFDKEILSRPQEIMVDRMKVSPEGEAELRVNFYGREIKEGDTVVLLVGDNMKNVKAKFLGYVKGSNEGEATIKVRLLDK